MTTLSRPQVGGASKLVLVLVLVLAGAPSLVKSDEAGSCPFSQGGEISQGWHSRPMPDDYSGGLKEFSVVYTDRALNHMSAPFVKVMQDLNGILNDVYNAAATVILPGSGTFAMVEPVVQKSLLHILLLMMSSNIDARLSTTSFVWYY